VDERQALATVRNVLRLENLAADVVAKLSPELRAIFTEVGKLMRNMPDGDIMRQMQYRQMQQRIASLFIPAHRHLYDELVTRLGEEWVRQLHFAENYLRVAEGTAKQVAAGSMPTQGVTIPVPQGTPVLGPGNFGIGGAFTREQLITVARDTQVLGKTLAELFNLEDVMDSPFFKQWIKNVDRVVKTGFLTGMTNEEIAKALIRAENMSITQARAVARTAVMDMSHRAHEAFWDANDEDIVAWTFDASLDYRVCEQCAPWDGVEKKRRDDLPRVPRHPNCRCQILPVTKAEMIMRKEGDSLKQTGASTYIELVPGERKVGDKWVNTPRPKGSDGVRYYSKPVFVNGKRYWRRVTDAPARDGRAMTMAGFLVRANNETRAQVMGKDRARRFGEKLKMKGPKGKPIYTPESALLSVMPRSK
jgi:SPP1 gp7 family putative phage head morphogenesis protein